MNDIKIDFIYKNDITRLNNVFYLISQEPYINAIRIKNNFQKDLKEKTKLCF